MNTSQYTVLKVLIQKNFSNQREISSFSGFSLGKVNRILDYLYNEQYINSNYKLTSKGKQYVGSHHPEQAIILAAGFGLRMVPINTEKPKGLLRIKGETLIERLIKQLHEVGITNIKIVVGFMKEHYEYLIDQYGVQLIVNPFYAVRNNVYSLYLAKNSLANSYIIPCDVWFENNPFSTFEGPSWYLFSEKLNGHSH